MDVRMVKQYSVFLPNKPGALSGLAKMFMDAGISLLGIASEVRDDSGVVRIAVEEDVDGSDVLIKNGFSAVERPLLSVDVPDRVGELYRLTTVLAEAGINITTVYGTAQVGQNCRLLIAVNDSKKAFEALKAHEPQATA